MKLQFVPEFEKSKDVSIIFGITGNYVVRITGT